ncbi:MAG: dihydrofolate reductase [Myxococcales bacterium]|nr:dihydrofolate reductase [Myxococcales bacterium]
MRKLVYYVATTVDGFIADEHHSVDALTNQGDHVTEYVDALKTYDTIVMGRRTYEFGLRFGVTDPYPWAETVVFGGLADAPPHPRVRFTREDPVGVIEALKLREGSPIYLCGGGRLARTLFDAGAVDELIVKISPVLLGSGIPLTMGLGKSVPLRHRSSKVHDVGVVVTRYEVMR